MRDLKMEGGVRHIYERSTDGRRLPKGKGEDEE